MTDEGAGRLRVRAAAGVGLVTAVEFGRLTNAELIAAPGVMLPATEFAVRRLSPAPFTVQFVVHDGCGPWSTFVGLGPATPTSTPTPP